MTRIPAFYFRRAPADDRAILEEAEDGGFTVIRHHGKVTFHGNQPWRPEFAEAYRRQGANSIEIWFQNIPRWSGLSLGFLEDLPDLRHLSLTIDCPIDLGPVAKLDRLESLMLQWQRVEHPGELDFGKFDRLLECGLAWHPSFESVLQVESLRILHIFDARELKGLDLRRLPRLVEFGLNNGPVVERIDFHEATCLLALELINCGKFRPDWDRLTTELRYLRLAGRLGFMVEDLAAAKALEFLWVELPSKKSSWTFLRNLPNLKAIWFLDLKISKEVAQLVRSINQAHGHGPTLGAPPSGRLLTPESPNRDDGAPTEGEGRIAFRYEVFDEWALRLVP